ncbi:MAG TPA: TraB/GumN family protein [Methylophilaceae bacterium]|nr:TraB/GumN family protein [Methylophilaceae bacterium]
MHTASFSGLVRSLFAAALFSFMLSAQAADKGLLWKIEAPSGKQSYLFGTMHSDDARINDFSPKLEQALADSDAFIMETLPPDDISVYFMQDARLQDLLNEDELEQVRQLADLNAMRDDIAMHMKPWLLAMVFDLPKPQSPFTQDVQLLDKARNLNKQILGLESTAEHFGTLDSFSREDQLTMLRAVLKRTPEEKQRDFDLLLNAYLSGDTVSIGALDDKITGGMLPASLWQKMRVKLIDERNVRMAQRIVEQADQHAVFVAVGASHLAGDNGLLAKLRSAGYKVSAL